MRAKKHTFLNGMRLFEHTRREYGHYHFLFPLLLIYRRSGSTKVVKWARFRALLPRAFAGSNPVSRMSEANAEAGSGT